MRYNKLSSLSLYDLSGATTRGVVEQCDFQQNLYFSSMWNYTKTRSIILKAQIIIIEKHRERLLKLLLYTLFRKIAIYSNTT